MNDTNITHSRLKEFCDTIIMQAREVLYDRETDILKAWHENIEEAQASDKKFPPLKLGIGATVDLENNTIETTLRFTAVYQSSLSTEIPDPNQPDLPGVSKALDKALGKYAQAVIDDNSRKIKELGETVYDSAEDDQDGPAIVDVDEPIIAKKLTPRGKSQQEGSADDY